MRLPLQITFRGMPLSAPLETYIRERAGQLEKHSHAILSCRVVIESPHHHHRKGNLYQVSIDIALPGHEIAITRHPQKHGAHQDAHTTIRDAFDAACRRVEAHVERRRSHTKHNHKREVIS